MSDSSASTTSSPSRQSLLRRMLAGATVLIFAVAGAIVGTPPAHAADKPLFGYVTDALTHEGVGGVLLSLINTTSFQTVSVTSVAPSGRYDFASVPSSGTYALFVDPQYASGGYAQGFYGSTYFFDLATPLNLTNSSNMEVSTELVKGGTLSGHISLTGPTRNIQVDVFGYNPTAHAWQTVGGTSIDEHGDWVYGHLPAGNFKVAFNDVSTPQFYGHEYYNDVIDEKYASQITVTAGSVITHIDATLTPDGPSPVVRLAGSDRFATSASIAETYSSANVVFVANGLGYPDALSAAPAAALLDAPLLLTRQNSLPAVVKAQIQRLHPEKIYVVGGTGVVSAAVFNELASMTSEIHRLSGSNRYATSLEVFRKVWEGIDVTTAFLADGRNFPDALSLASAAGKENGPVILVDGGSSELASGVKILVQDFSANQLVLAGGTAVLSAGIESSAAALPGMLVNRYFGANRYLTSWEVNDHFFFSSLTVFLAVGTGYADALAGAALAGSVNAPLYLIPGNCVPQNVLDAIASFGATRIVLLGGTGVLSPAVEALTSCTP